jgi:hypothetical protein
MHHHEVDTPYCLACVRFTTNRMKLVLKKNLAVYLSCNRNYNAAHHKQTAPNLT